MTLQPHSPSSLLRSSSPCTCLTHSGTECGHRTVLKCRRCSEPRCIEHGHGVRLLDGDEVWTCGPNGCRPSFTSNVLMMRKAAERMADRDGISLEAALSIIRHIYGRSGQ